ncbi:cell division protein FtsX [Alicyclobacillus contaminans]|uniref:permease-like cell division protein FtsX n=1 Tax=Alicyclobacillus contaminans TaxID=392016 RepID=UPI00047D8A33|nr:permease-like cell division protein FtsX [Alicyclobacillus contaminans]GMA50277.1 cell division protein FtsX [Alicyclobacillus contaminans]
MKISMLGRHIREGCKNLLRNSWMSIASVGAVAITLLILGVTLVIALNAQQLSNYMAGQLQVNAFLKQNVTKQQALALDAEIKALPGVQEAIYVPKDQGFKELQQSLGKEYQEVLQGFSKNNPIPDKIVVKAKDPKQTLGIAAEIRQMDGVDKVDDGKQVVDKLFRFLDMVRNIGVVFVVGLVVMAMFLISNTIKITIFSRRREIEIMKLVGATDWFIRWPFLTEGIIIGVVGALVPFALIVYGYHSAFVRMGGTFLAVAFPLIPTGALAQKLALVMFGLGIFIGIWGGIMSVRRFLRV